MVGEGGTGGSGDYNRVYEKLVGNDSELVGMLAYAIYKKMKREWILANRPSRAEVDGFHKTVTETQLELCRNEASGLLVKYADAVLEQSAPAYRQDGANSEIVAEVKRQQSLWKNILVNVVGSILFAFALYILGLIYLSPSIPDFVKQTGGQAVAPQAPQSPVVTKPGP